MARRRVKFTFPTELITDPIIYELGHRFKVVTNIRRADVREDMGLGCARTRRLGRRGRQQSRVGDEHRCARRPSERRRDRGLAFTENSNRGLGGPNGYGYYGEDTDSASQSNGRSGQSGH